MKQHGVAGFYRGFAAAILVEGIWSASWWASYGMFLELIGKVAPDGTSHFVIQGVSGMLSGIIATVIGNPLDIVKVRLQVGEVLCQLHVSRVLT